MSTRIEQVVTEFRAAEGRIVAQLERLIAGQEKMNGRLRETEIANAVTSTKQDSLEELVKGRLRIIMWLLGFLVSLIAIAAAIMVF
jgi:hypothetical protein